jgi:asparagine synthase (glutamine-hydrolysing)
MVAADGAPVDRALLDRMTRSMAFRGPDGQGAWSLGSVGLGHTLLRTADESANERQPATLDGEVWIAADARIDRREDLVRELGLARDALTGPDCFLILHAYARWGEACVEHLVGDFAFAIWDGRERKLFCARDHFGVRPFFYARPHGGLVVGNTLNCVRIHPGVSDRLDELAVADFLLFDINQDLSATIFADIRRLPPAHALTWAAAGLKLRRYWSMPDGAPTRRRRFRDHVERFGELLEQSVRDRVRMGRASVFFSGGLDSTSVAAAALRVAPSLSLRGFTAVYRSLIPDDEEEFARVAARHIGMPLEILAVDEYPLFEPPELYATPEPFNEPLAQIGHRLNRAAAGHAPVALTGEGGDILFYVAPILGASSLVALADPRTALALGAYTLDQRRVPRFHLRGTVRRWLGQGQREAPPFPRHLDRAFVERNGLEERWAASQRPEDRGRGRRGHVASLIAGPYWPSVFESGDPARTGVAVEYAHPLFSLPLVSHMITVPEIPFCVDKLLLRAWTRAILPEAVRRRPKSPLRADPFSVKIRERLAAGEAAWPAPGGGVRGFIDLDVFAAEASAGAEPAWWGLSRVATLDLWLESLRTGEHQCPTQSIPPALSTKRPSSAFTETRES